MEGEGNRVEVDGQSLSVRPDVSQSMERERNRVEVEGEENPIFESSQSLHAY